MRIASRVIKLPSITKISKKLKSAYNNRYKLIFNRKHLGNPFCSEKISTSERIARTLTNLALAIFTCGIYHGIKCYKSHHGRFKPVEIENNTFYQKTDHAWKTFVGLFSPRPDFSFKSPKVDLSELEHLTPEIKSKVEAKCLQKMRDSMIALDLSIGDGIKELIKTDQLPKVKETVNVFSKRVLEVYQAYVDLHIEQDTPTIPTNIGAIKAGGFTHSEILKLKEPCAWYANKVQAFKESLKDVEGYNLSENEAQALVIHIASCGYRWGISKKNQGRLSESLNETNKILENHPDREALETNCKEFCKDLKSNSDNFQKIKRFDVRIRFVKSLSQQEKEDLKDDIANISDKKPNKGSMAESLLKDPKFRLLEEMRQRFTFRDHEPGYLGSPLSMLNILEGKYDDEAADGNYRNKLFFTYGSKNIINEILISPEMTAGVNRKLQERNCGWQIEDSIANLLRDRSKSEPVYSLGLYARENNLGNKTRHWKTHNEFLQIQTEDPNHSFADGERLAQGNHVSPEELMKRFRINLSPQEEMTFFGTNSHLDEIEVRRNQMLEEHYLSESQPASPANSEASTCASDVSESDSRSDCSRPIPSPKLSKSHLKYKKETTQMPWAPGKHFFTLHDDKKCDSPYVRAVKELGIPQYAGISGSSDAMFTMAGTLGIRSKEALLSLRAVYLPWMISHEDHTADEIMTSLKTFGLPYTPAPDYYNQILPSNTDLTNAIQKHQRSRGFELPEYYLSKQFAKESLIELRKEQDDTVQDLLQNHQLLLKGMRTYKPNYNIKDLFAVNKWKRSSNEYLPETTAKMIRRKIRNIGKLLKRKSKTVEFRLNPETQMFEKFDPKKEMTLTGSELNSVSIIPPSGKIVPYAPFDWPDLNRTGYLFNAEQSEIPANLIFSSDANVDIRQAWVKHYTPKEMEAPDFQQRLINDSREAHEFNTTHAHQTSREKLIEGFANKPNEFLPYNEVNASIKKEGIVGVYYFSKGLPTRIRGAKVVPETDVATKKYGPKFVKFDYKPLQHESVVNFKKDESYDHYMLMMGIARKIATKEQFGKEVPLYEINTTTDTGLSYICDEDLVKKVQDILNDEAKLNGIVRCIKHQSRIKTPSSKVKESLIETLESFLINLK